MIRELFYSKTVRKIAGCFVIPIPKEISEKMHIKEHELVQVMLKKLEVDDEKTLQEDE